MKALSVKYVVFFLFFLGFQQLAQANEETRYYDITVAGFTIGELAAKKTEKGNITEYEMKSLVNLWFFGTLRVEFNSNSIYKNGQFISSRTVSKSNRGEFLSIIYWDGEKYIVDANSYKSSSQKPILIPIEVTTALMFFEEPTGTETYLSENYGVTCPIKKSDDGVVEVLIDGNRNKFYFEEGVLVKANMQNPIKNYVLKLRR